MLSHNMWLLEATVAGSIFLYSGELGGERVNAVLRDIFQGFSTVLRGIFQGCNIVLRDNFRGGGGLLFRIFTESNSHYVSVQVFSSLQRENEREGERDGDLPEPRGPLAKTIPISSITAATM